MSTQAKRKLVLKSSFLNKTKDGKFQKPELNFKYDALAPVINEETVNTHYNGHHSAYVTNLNKAIDGAPELAKLSIEEILCDLEAIPSSIRTAVINNGGGHCNHSLYWSNLTSAEQSGSPSEKLSLAIEKSFGNFEEFRSQLANCAITTFGSGWGWLTVNPEQKLQIESSANQSTPLSLGNIPVLVIDVWEHAYYLDYKNKRPAYVEKIFSIINWENVSQRYEEALANFAA